jgi:hypothetical protein
MNIIGLFGKLVLFAAASWLLVHVLALFGVILAVALPVWWLISPENIPVIINRDLKTGQRAHVLLNLFYWMHA